MGANAKTAMKGVEVSDAAARRIAQIVAKEPGKSALRVSVEGGGCSGFSYKYELVAGGEPEDIVIEKAGATGKGADTEEVSEQLALVRPPPASSSFLS